MPRVAGTPGRKFALSALKRGLSSLAHQCLVSAFRCTKNRINCLYEALNIVVFQRVPRSQGCNKLFSLLENFPFETRTLMQARRLFKGFGVKTRLCFEISEIELLNQNEIELIVAGCAFFRFPKTSNLRRFVLRKKFTLH